MALAGPWGIYYHIPKCGGITIRKYYESKFRVQGVELVGFHAFPSQMDDEHKAIDHFTFVRHPAEWLLSFYSYMRAINWTWEELPEDIDQKFIPYYGMFWPMFVDAVCSKSPGVVGEVFDMYAVNGVTVHRLEDIDAVFGAKAPVIHATEDKPLMTDEHRQMICKAERGTLWRYGYE